ncbi:NAD(P)-dependent dehydrogenase (short-subunit alcohol dehydrogenase family) [Bacillus mesophilus]|uniref:Glucose 1-dehydrogenase n=1 Tax=Bacillus mesophilus TaxID=1808955 RepID=A0A6M0Q270_9BACI|nr:glucose 1-dehydrogenase [Bacillus mesophilus]MBM7659601.1 NAD(P)-dependent dehydrogenase (short-subunit alcohol dehydrogenase family) [Bacillus mesophilus]NEY70471.1 glucose 1-dehydrogenase [Bacillus mesophilus]
MRLKGKVSIVTGGASGIGRATALTFAREGSHIVLSDINEKKGAETLEDVKNLGAEAIFVKTDVSKEEDMKQLMNEAVTAFGGIDILFNNAGVGNENVRLADLSVEEWDRVVDINLKGVFLGMKFVIPEMIKRGGGSIINTSSLLGFKGKKYLAPYNASKGGVILLTQNAAVEYGTKGIRVNAVAPGVIDTAIVDNWREDERVWNAVTKSNALGRVGSPNEVANAVLFLASDEASYITGTSILVDGGALTF